MNRRVIDMHHHVSSLEEADALVKENQKLGIVKTVLLGLPPPREPGINEVVLSASRRYPELLIPFVGFDLDVMVPDDLPRFTEMGYRGIKFIAPSRPYNDSAYFPVYEKAARLKMPGLFHLGIVANTSRWRNVDSNLMRPIHLDHIARCIPEFTLIGAHLGNPWIEEAAMACRWNPNLFFDISGSTLKYRTPEFLGGLLWWKPGGQYSSPDRTDAWEKIVFGSDVAAALISDVMNDYDNLLTTLNIDPGLQEAVWYKTAARILGLDMVCKAG